MTPKRDFGTWTDHIGPQTDPQPQLSRAGLGGRLVAQSNPVSFLTDWLSPCLPFVSLSGGQDPASAAVRQGVLDNNDQARGFSLPRFADPAGNPNHPSTGTQIRPAWADAVLPNGNFTKADGQKYFPAATAPKSTSGPFGYIVATDQVKGK